MNSRSADQSEATKNIFPSVPDLTDEDSTDIFFSFDVTAWAFLWEHKHQGVNGITSLTRLEPKKKENDFEKIGVVVLYFLRDFFCNPTSYGYILLFLLIAILALNPASIQEKVRETMTIMLAPEVDVPKPKPAPPPPPPKPIKKEKIAKPKPVKKELPKPKPPKQRKIKEEQVKLKLQQPKALKKEAPKTKPIAKKRLMAKPMDEKKLGMLGSKADRKAEDFRLDNLSTTRRVDEAAQGFKVRARSSSDAPADLPTSFAVTSPQRKLEEENVTTSLSSIGKKERRLEDDTEKLKIETAKRTDVELENTALEVGVGRRGESDIENVDLNIQVAQRDEPVESAPDALSLPEASKSDDLRYDEEYKGVWQKLENIGPVAHLNAKCFGISDNRIVRYRQYKFRCAKNQIREAWKQVQK